MKRFSLREFALLCAPVLFVAVAGFVLSRRSSSSGMQMHIEAPTTLEAWKGTDATIVITNKRGYIGNPILQVNTRGQWQSVDDLAPFRHSQLRWCKGTSESESWMRYPINVRAVPQGPLRFGFQYSTNINANVPFDKKQFWPLDRTQIRPFPFAQMPRAPMVTLRSVTVHSVYPSSSSSSHVSGDVTFDVVEGAAGADDSFESSIVSSTCSLSWNTVAKQPTPTTRVVSFDADTGSTSPSGLTVITGRVSAGRHWPLAFLIEPFTMAKMKVGQHLKFKSWPAPMPAPVPNP